MLALDLLGPLLLRRDGVALVLRTKKTQALLVLLARSAALPRPRVVALLWPTLDEHTGRRNLRRELARLREAGAADAVRRAGDFLALADAVQLDTRAFDSAFADGRPDDALALWRGPPADGLTLDDAEAFNDWLSLERERLIGQRRRALEAAAAASEARGDVATALQRVESLLDDDPLQEQRHRDAMRLLALMGRREAALAQFDRCRGLLEAELGLSPMAETEVLARSLRESTPAGDAPAPPHATPPAGDATAAPAAAAPPPASLLSTPMPFVGRDAEVAALEAAWRAGRTIFIEGEAGVGKSRLAVDFAAAHGPYALMRSRPGDRDVPYATFVRALRTLAGSAPDLSALPPWALGELARLLPELGRVTQPLRSPAEHSRFMEACAQGWFALCSESFDAVVFDDWHHADGASRAMLSYIVQRRREQALTNLRELLVSRPEADAAAQQASARLRESADALHLPLPPLPPAAVLELVRQLSGVAQPTRFAARLSQATGGNPFFMAETLRHLAERDLLAVAADGTWRTPFDDATQDYRELPVPARVHDAVLARVQRLPAAAQRVLEAAALAAEPFAPALLAPACALSELDAVLAIEAALQAQLVREHEAGGYRFAHDLVQQAIDSALTPERRRLVHRRLALGAEAAAAPPGVIASHHEASGDAPRAVAHRLAAGDAAQRLQALDEAVTQWQQGLADTPTPSQAAQLQMRLMRVLLKLDQREAGMAHAMALQALAAGEHLPDVERAEAWVAVAAHLATDRHEAASLALLDALALPLDERQQAQAMAVRAMALRGVGQVEASNAAAHAALAMPGMVGWDRANLLDSMGMNEHLAGRMQAAAALAEAAAALFAQLGDTYGVVRAICRRGTFLLELGDLAGAVRELRRGVEECQRYGYTFMQRGTLFNLVCTYAALTEPALILATAQQGWALQPPLPPGNLRLMYRTAFVEAHLALGDLGAAWEHAAATVDEALALGTQLSLGATIRTCIELLVLLQAHDRVARLLGAIDADALRQMPQIADEMWVARAQAALQQHEPAVARQALAQVGAPEAIENPRQRVRLAQARAELAWAEGDAVAALALLPTDEAPGQNDELRLCGLALRTQCEAAGGSLPAATVTALQTLLAAAKAHPLAALRARRALADAQAAGVAGAPSQAQPDHAAHVQRLAASLHAHPPQRAAFLRSAAGAESAPARWPAPQR